MRLRLLSYRWWALWWARHSIVVHWELPTSPPWANSTLTRLSVTFQMLKQWETSCVWRSCKQHNNGWEAHNHCWAISWVAQHKTNKNILIEIHTLSALWQWSCLCSASHWLNLILGKPLSSETSTFQHFASSIVNPASCCQGRRSCGGKWDEGVDQICDSTHSTILQTCFRVEIYWNLTKNIIHIQTSYLVLSK